MKYASPKYSIRLLGVAATGMMLSAFTPTTTAQQREVLIEEIVVTATQRERSIQDIPVSVNSIATDELTMIGVTDVAGLAQVVPTFYLTSTSSEVEGTTARIRGIGTQGNNPGLEAAVGIFIDGVYRNRTSVGFADLGQVERIEVLRGPQGTLFGRNTSAGMVHVITQQPAFEETQAYFNLSTGSYRSVKAAGGYSTGNEDITGGIDFTYTQRDGFFNDVSADEDFNTRNRHGLKGQLVFEPSDDFTVRLIADHAERDESCCVSVHTLQGLRTRFAVEAISAGQDTSNPEEPFVRKSYTTPGRNYDTQVDEYGLSGQVDWIVGDAQLTSITAYRDWEAKSAGDLDYSAEDIAYRDVGDMAQHFQTFTQEFRLNGHLIDGEVDWLVGMFYSDEGLDMTLGTKVGSDYRAFSENLFGLFAGAAPAPVSLGFGPLNGDGANDDFNTQTKSLALFTHNTWRPVDRLELTLGLRKTLEEKDLAAVIDTTGAACATALAAGGFAGDGSPVTPFAGDLTPAVYALYCLGGVLNSTLDGHYADSRDEDNLSGTLAVSYSLTEQLMVFVSYANGYKSGGYNLDRSGLDPDTVFGEGNTFGIDTDVNALEFKEEAVDAYELGLKATLADGALNLNATYFYQDFENFQLNTFNGLAFFVVTLDEVISEGIEIDVRSTLGENLSINAGLLWNVAEYAEDVKRSDGVSAIELAGKQLTHAPKWSATGAVTYEFVLEGMDAFAHLGLRYTGEHNTGSDLNPEKMQDAYTLFNARVGLASPQQIWSAALWVQNLTDEEYYQVVIDTPLQNTAGDQLLESYSAFLGEPRTWGVSVGYKF
jgi:iron complex outermembrane recepter protein